MSPKGISMKLPQNNTGRILTIATALSLASASVVWAQIEGPKRGIAPLASTGDFEVTGIEVNATGKDAMEARRKGWEEAQRKGWDALWAKTRGGKSSLSDSTLDGIVAAIVVEEEQIGPKRYVAKLGISFDRARAGQLLGVGGIASRSAPMMILPILYNGAAATVYEQQTAWQRAWATYRTADSKIDYIRPSGAGGESLLLNAGQIGRRSRQWWRVILDQFGAADVIIPIARIERSFPGGPIVGKFSARHGPDNRFLGSFELRAANSAALPAMMEQAVKKMDELFIAALNSGQLRADSTLTFTPETIAEEDLAPLETALPEVKEKVEKPKDDKEADDPVEKELRKADEEERKNDNPNDKPAPLAVPVTTQTVSVQANTATAADVDRAEASLRGIPGVQSVSTTSLALGGTSVIRVTYQGDPDAFKAALSARGFR
jgi:hypothetical protein